MTLGERIDLRRKQVGIRSQAELARRAQVPQATLNGLIRKPYRWSPHLVRIASELRTSVAYLTGATDDPDAAAPPAAPASTLFHVMMPVALPSENALARMFEGLLEVADRSAPTAELARELAQLLPTGLSQLRGQLTELAPIVSTRPEAAPAALASDDRAPRQ